MTSQEEAIDPGKTGNVSSLEPSNPTDSTILADDLFPPGAAYKLFVGQVPRSCDEAALRPLFERCGELEELVIIRDRNTGYHRGCAFVTFTTAPAAAMAIDLFQGKKPLPACKLPMQVRVADTDKEYKLFIGHVPSHITDEQLVPVFTKFGAIVEAVIIRDPNTGESKRSAFVRYQRRDAALAAIAELHTTRPWGGEENAVVKFARTRKDFSGDGNVANGKEPRSAPRPGGAGGGGGGGGYRAAGAPDSDSAHSAAGQHAHGRAGQFHHAGPPGAVPAFGHDGHGAAPRHGNGASHAPAAGPRMSGPPGANLIIHNLPTDLVESDLAVAFSQFGPIISAHVMLDHSEEPVRCVGYVSYADPAHAALAIQGMDGFRLDGLVMSVKVLDAGTAPVSQPAPAIIRGMPPAMGGPMMPGLMPNPWAPMPSMAPPPHVAQPLAQAQSSSVSGNSSAHSHGVNSLPGFTTPSPSAHLDMSQAGSAQPGHSGAMHSAMMQQPGMSYAMPMPGYVHDLGYYSGRVMPGGASLPTASYAMPAAVPTASLYSGGGPIMPSSAMAGSSSPSMLSLGIRTPAMHPLSLGALGAALPTSTGTPSAQFSASTTPLAAAPALGSAGSAATPKAMPAAPSLAASS